MGEQASSTEPVRRRVYDYPFAPKSVDDLRDALDKAGMMFRRRPAGKVRETLYPDHLIVRLFDEYRQDLRSFFVAKYEHRRPVLETAMNTFRGKIHYRPASPDAQYLVQCAGDLSEGQLQQLGVVDPYALPPGLFLKKDSSTSGKLPMRGGADPLVALHAEMRRQLNVAPHDFRMHKPPETAYEEKKSFLFPGLLTRFTNTTYFLEMLDSGYRDQYLHQGEPALKDGVFSYPVTVSRWVPAK